MIIAVVVRAVEFPIDGIGVAFDHAWIIPQERHFVPAERAADVQIVERDIEGGCKRPHHAEQDVCRSNRREQEFRFRENEHRNTAADELQRRGIDAIYRGKNTPAESSGILRVLALIERKLRKAFRSPPSAEKEVEDAFETLLHGADLAFSRESERIVYSSKTYVPDFVFARLDLAVEFKLCIDGREKALIPEINDDILAYRTKYGNLIFAVYDNGSIRDIESFTASFEQQEHVLVRVVKH